MTFPDDKYMTKIWYKISVGESLSAMVPMQGTNSKKEARAILDGLRADSLFKHVEVNVTQVLTLKQVIYTEEPQEPKRRKPVGIRSSGGNPIGRG